MKHELIALLPTDRAYLHFEAVPFGNGYQVDYELVIPLKETDCRGTWDQKGRKTRPRSHRTIWLDTQNNKRIPLGRTNVGTDSPSYPFGFGRLDLPFRDGAHCQWDNERLGGLPLIYTVRGEHFLLTKEEEPQLTHPTP